LGENFTSRASTDGLRFSGFSDCVSELELPSTSHALNDDIWPVAGWCSTCAASTPSDAARNRTPPLQGLSTCSLPNRLMFGTFGFISEWDVQHGRELIGCICYSYTGVTITSRAPPLCCGRQYTWTIAQVWQETFLPPTLVPASSGGIASGQGGCLRR